MLHYLYFYFAQGGICNFELRSALIFYYAAGDTGAVGLGVTGKDGTGALGLGLVISVPLELSLAEGLSEASSDGEGLGVSDNSPKMFVGPERVGVLKALYSKPSLSGYIIFFQICAAGLPVTYIRAGVS